MPGAAQVCLGVVCDRKELLRKFSMLPPRFSILWGMPVVNGIVNTGAAD